MKTFLTSLGIWVGGITAVLALVDWVLTEAQKKRLRGWGETAWLWLDDQRLGKFVNLVRKKGPQVAASITVIVFFLAAAILGMTVELAGKAVGKRIYLILGAYSLGLIAAMVYVAWKIHPKITDWILRSASLKGFFGRCLAIALPCLAASFFIEYLLTFVVSTGDQSGRMAVVVSEQTYLIILAIVYLITSPIRFEAGMVSTMLTFSLAWLVIVLLLMALFAIAKFVLIRIVESPKGPVLGLSGLLIALIKAFT
jgi:hypothetical protein